MAQADAGSQGMTEVGGGEQGGVPGKVGGRQATEQQGKKPGERRRQEQMWGEGEGVHEIQRTCQRGRKMQG